MIDRRSLIAGGAAGIVVGVTRRLGAEAVRSSERAAPQSRDGVRSTERAAPPDEGAAPQSHGPESAAQDIVRSRERAFAESMAKRDFAAFSTFLSPEAIFFGGPDGDTAARGRDAVLTAWKPLFERPTAPFSWAPDLVEVTASGTMAITSGPVLDARGQRTGRFNSVWRLDPDGQWRVLFDRGCPGARC